MLSPSSNALNRVSFGIKNNVKWLTDWRTSWLTGWRSVSGLTWTAVRSPVRFKSYREIEIFIFRKFHSMKFIRTHIGWLSRGWWRYLRISGWPSCANVHNVGYGVEWWWKIGTVGFRNSFSLEAICNFQKSFLSWQPTVPAIIRHNTTQ